MPGPSDVATGNCQLIMLLSVPVSTAALASGPSTTERTFTVPGLLPNDHVVVTKPTFQNTIGIVGVRVSAADTLAINFLATAGTPTPTVENYLLKVTRYENISTGIGTLPTAITP